MKITLDISLGGKVEVVSVDAPYTEMNLLVSNMVLSAVQDKLRPLNTSNPMRYLHEAFGVSENAWPEDQ